uniref:Protein synganglion overexpressed n=1 Tax=Rhipicephalus microplus TaxID=6941 RepID=A0A6M2D338_RHIMP
MSLHRTNVNENCHSLTLKARCSNKERHTKKLHRYAQDEHEQLSQFLICRVEAACSFHKCSRKVSKLTCVLSLTNVTSKQTCGGSISGAKHPNLGISAGVIEPQRYKSSIRAMPSPCKDTRA